MHYALLPENIECIVGCHTSNTNDSYLQPDKEIAVSLAYDKRTITSHLLINYIECYLYLIAIYFNETFNENFNT